MGESEATTGHTEGLAMLETFASVGAVRFDMTWTNAAGDKQRFRRGVPLATLTRTLPAILAEAERRQHNVIVRPDGPCVSFIQLDDLKAPALAQLAPPVFLILETSPGNHQAWVAIEGEEDKEFARRLRKGTGPDISRADFVWCMTAITWGWTAEEAADRLMEESAKAQKNGKGYAELTARNAALAEQRRRSPAKPQRDPTNDVDRYA